jgi:hypothetical protein
VTLPATGELIQFYGSTSNADDVPFLFFTAHDPNLDFDPPSDADFAADLEVWRAECAVSREIVAAHDLDDTARPLDWYEDIDLRWLVLR